mgnify:CR=1 FL=1
MKNLIYLTIIGLLFAACGGSDDSGSSEAINVAPTVPALKVPADNKLCVDNTVSFQWDLSTDANKDVITYQIQVAKENTFAQIVKSSEVTTNNTSIALEKNTAYFWRVKATDSKGLASTYSATFKLYTSGETVVNHMPFSPELVSPVLNATLNATTVSLKWNATDVDTADALTYDVYFGTTNPPTEKVSENKSEKTIDVTTVATKEYFWKVVVKDNKGGETVGQIWKFKTN